MNTGVLKAILARLSLHLLAVVVLFGISLIGNPAKVSAQNILQCGTAFYSDEDPPPICQCSSGESPYFGDLVCCGWVFSNPDTGQLACVSTNSNPFDPDIEGGDIIITEGVSNATFDILNPLQIGGGENINVEAASDFATDLSTPGGIVTRLLEFAFPLAGLLLFLMLVWGGFEILAGSATKKSVDAGKQRITAAILGFLLLFATYWIGQLLEVVFGVVIL